MTSNAAAKDLETLNTLVTAKEQEWRNLLQQQISALTNELLEKDKQISLERLRFNKLKKDFEYNLDLLAKRDIELEKYDCMFVKLKENIKLQDAELSEMKMKIDVAEKKCFQAMKENKENRISYQMRLKKLQDEANIFCEKKEIEIANERLQYEELKNTFLKQKSELQENFEIQKIKLHHENENKLSNQKKDYQVILNQKETEIYENKLKVKMLSKEVELLQTSASLATDHAAADQEKLMKFEKQLAQKVLEIESVNRMKDIQLKELEAKVEGFCQSSIKKKEKMRKKWDDLQRCCNSKEVLVENLKKSADEKEEIFQKKLKICNEQNEALSFQLKQYQLKYFNNEKVLETKLLSTQQEINHLKFTIKHLQDKQSQSTVARDVENATLHLSESNLKKDLDTCKVALQKCKKELELALEREKIHEENNILSQGNWKRLMENKLNEISDKHRNAISKLENEQENLKIILQKKENELLQKESIVQKLKETDSIALDVQNQQLKMVIKEMRTEMELFNEQMKSQSLNPPNETYLLSLESEIASLKSANRDLKNKLEDHITQSASGKYPVILEHAWQTQLDELNKIIGVLQNEKMELLASLKLKDSTIVCMRNNITALENEKHQQAITIEAICFDSSSRMKNYDHKITAMKKQIIDLQLESELNYKHGVECNFDATHFNCKSELKMASEREKQLSDDYKKACVTQNHPCKDFCKHKWKLKLAIDRIKNLLIERVKMISCSNRLRADFKSLQGKYAETCGMLNDNINKCPLKYTKVTENHPEQGVPGDSEIYQKQTTSDTLENHQKQTALETFENHQKVLQTLESPHKFTIIDKEVRDQNSDEYKDVLNPVFNHLISSSSDSSLREVWKLLELGDSFSNLDSTFETKQQPMLAVRGKPVVAEQRIIHKKSFIAPRFREKKKFARNYNDKNDNNFSKV